MKSPTKRPSLAEPVTELRKVRIVDNGDPLVRFMDVCPLLIWDRPRFKYRREEVVRSSVADMLRQGAEYLATKGYRLAITEGWRPPIIQRRLYNTVKDIWRTRHPEWSETKLVRVTNQFTAPMNEKVPPPHTTGGAVDLLLANADGVVLDHISPYKEFDHRAFYFDAPNLSDEARRARDLLAEAFAPTAFTNYPSEYWHWSYGDQGWAYRGGHPHALYGALEPDGWKPDPADDVDAHLERLDSPDVEGQ